MDLRVSTNLGLIPAVLLLFAATVTTAKSSEVTYNYTGDDFDSFVDPCCGLGTSSFITASFTFASALPDNMILTDETGALLDWWAFTNNYEIAFGPDSLSFDPPGHPPAYFSVELATDGNGDIVGWAFGGYDPYSGGGLTSTGDLLTGTGSDEAWLNGVSEVQSASGSSTGTWTVSPETQAIATPEPATTVLAALGAIPFFAMRQRRRVSSCTKR